MESSGIYQSLIGDFESALQLLSQRWNDEVGRKIPEKAIAYNAVLAAVNSCEVELVAQVALITRSIPLVEIEDILVAARKVVRCNE